MARCETCRRLDALESWWDKVRTFFFNFFKTDIIELSEQKYTRGFADGYAAGFKKAEEKGKYYFDSYVDQTKKIEIKHD